MPKPHSRVWKLEHLGNVLKGDRLWDELPSEIRIKWGFFGGFLKVPPSKFMEKTQDYRVCVLL